MNMKTIKMNAKYYDSTIDHPSMQRSSKFWVSRQSI